MVVSEETGKISIAKDGTLIADVNEDNLRKILIRNIIKNVESLKSDAKTKGNEENDKKKLNKSNDS